MNSTERGVKNRAIPFVLILMGVIVASTIIHFVFIVDEVEDNVSGETPAPELNER